MPQRPIGRAAAQAAMPRAESASVKRSMRGSPWLGRSRPLLTSTFLLGIVSVPFALPIPLFFLQVVLFPFSQPGKGFIQVSWLLS